MHRLQTLIRSARTVCLSEWPAKVVVVEIAFIDQLTTAGFSVIEATSFVSPKRVPQLSDAAQVMAGIRRRSGVRYPVLTPNMKGLENAMAAGATDIALFTAASEEFCQRNLNASIDASLNQFRDLATLAKRSNIRIRGSTPSTTGAISESSCRYVSCAMGCPFEGAIDPKRVAEVSRALIEMGCYEVSIGDTIGVGTAASVQRVFEECFKEIPVHQLAAHMHDTYGQGLSNVLTSLQLGISTVDASVAGLGGCPFATGATGNVATEDVLYLLDGLGIEHGVDWERVLKANAYITQVVDTTNKSRAASALRARLATPFSRP